jgi:hypothetical protein
MCREQPDATVIMTAKGAAIQTANPAKGNSTASSVRDPELRPGSRDFTLKIAGYRDGRLVVIATALGRKRNPEVGYIEVDPVTGRAIWTAEFELGHHPEAEVLINGDLLIKTRGRAEDVAGAYAELNRRGETVWSQTGSLRPFERTRDGAMLLRDDTFQVFEQAKNRQKGLSGPPRRIPAPTDIKLCFGLLRLGFGQPLER